VAGCGKQATATAKPVQGALRYGGKSATSGRDDGNCGGGNKTDNSNSEEQQQRRRTDNSKSQCRGLSATQQTMKLSVALVEMTEFGGGGSKQTTATAKSKEAFRQRRR
jgi:hypothetical protein